MRDTLGEDTKYSWDGIFRAKCIKDDDPKYQGRIKVWIPDLMPQIGQAQGLWARPANNQMGGRNKNAPEGTDHDYQGACMIPPKGSWLYIFFESGDPSEPRYLAAGDYGQGVVVSECRQGPQYWKKWVPIKTRMGRTFVLSDDVFDERVELCGKKRKISSPPDGDDASVTQIDTNMTTILLDERPGKEKLLIRTVKGDYIHVDIDQQMLQCYFKNDIRIQTEGNLHINVARNFNMTIGEHETKSIGMQKHLTVGMDSFRTIGITDQETVGTDKVLTVGKNYNRQIATNDNETVGAVKNVTPGAAYNLDAPSVNINSGMSGGSAQPPAVAPVPNSVSGPSPLVSQLPAGPTPGGGPVLPDGERDD